MYGYQHQQSQQRQPQQPLYQQSYQQQQPPHQQYQQPFHQQPQLHHQYQHQQEQHYGSYGPPPPLPSPYPSVNSYIPPSEAVNQAAGPGAITGPGYGQGQGQGHPYLGVNAGRDGFYQSAPGSSQRISFVQPAATQYNNGGTVGGNDGNGSDVIFYTLNGANPWVETRQTVQHEQHGVQNYTGDGSSSAIAWENSSTTALSPQVSTSTSAPASAAVTGSAYAPSGFAGITPRPTSYQAPPEIAFASFPSSGPPLPGHELVSYGNQFDNSVMHQEPPPLPPRPPSVLYHQLNSITTNTSQPVQRKPISGASVDGVTGAQITTVSDAHNPQGMRSSLTPAAKAAQPPLPPRYSIGFQQMVPLPPPPPRPPSQYHNQQQQQQQHVPISASATTNPRYSPQPLGPQNHGYRPSVQPTNASYQGSSPHQNLKLHHPAPSHAPGWNVQQSTPPTQPSTSAGVSTAHSAHQGLADFNPPNRQNTERYASSISSSILYESTPPPQEQMMQPAPQLPPLPPPNPPVSNYHEIHQQNNEKPNGVALVGMSNVTVGEDQNKSAAFITPVTTGTSTETSAGPSISPTSRPIEVEASQAIETRRYLTSSSIDTNPPERRPVSPVNTLNRFTSDKTISTFVSDAAPQSSSRLAESPKSYADELGLFASATGGLSGWGVDTDDPMGDLSAVTIRPSLSSALVAKEGREGNGKEGQEAERSNDDTKSLEDGLAELPHHPLPTRNASDSGTQWQQQQQQQQQQHGPERKSSDVSAVSMPDGWSSSPVPSRPPLAGRPSTPISLRDELGKNGDKPSGSTIRQGEEIPVASVIAPDDAMEKKRQVRNSLITTSALQSKIGGAKISAAFNSNEQEEQHPTNESEPLTILSESYLENFPVKNETDTSTDSASSSRKVPEASAAADENSITKNGFSNVKILESTASEQIEGQLTPSKASPEPTRGENEPIRSAVYAEGLDSRSRASLHRYIGMLHEEAGFVSAEEKADVFIDFITSEAVIRGIDLRTRLLPVQPVQIVKRDHEMTIGGQNISPSTLPTPFSKMPQTNRTITEAPPDLEPINNTAMPVVNTIHDNAVITTSADGKSSPILKSKDSFGELLQEYSPGGRPIIKRPPRVERVIPRLSTPTVGQMIRRRTTAVPVSEEKIFVDHEDLDLDRDRDVQAFLTRNPSARKRAATLDILTPIIGDASHNSSNGDVVGENNNATASNVTSAAGSDVSSNTAIMTPPGSDLDEGITGSGKKRNQQHQQKGQDKESGPMLSTSTYKPYALVHSRLSAPPETVSVVTTAAASAASTARKRESVSLNKVHEQELSAVLGSGSTNRRFEMNDEKRLSKLLSIAEAPIQSTIADSGSNEGVQDDDINVIVKPSREEKSDCNTGSSSAADTDYVGKAPRIKPLQALTALCSLLPNDWPGRRTPSPLLQPIWNQISNYPSLSSSSISLGFVPSVGAREITKEKDFPWISNLYASFHAQSTRIRARLDIERQQRTEVAKQRTEQLYNDNEIGYADIGSLENKFEREEKEIMAKEHRAEYARFTAEVFGPVYGALQREVGRLMWLAEHVRERFLSGKRMSHNKTSNTADSYVVALGLEALGIRTSPRKNSPNMPANSNVDASLANNLWVPSENVTEPNPPILEEALCLFVCIHDKIEGRHERMVQALADRDERYKRSELEPLAYSSSVDYSNIGSKNTDGRNGGGEYTVQDTKKMKGSATVTFDAESNDAKSEYLQQKADMDESKQRRRQQQQQQQKLPNPQLRYLEQHFASAAHSAALSAAQDRHARLTAIFEGVFLSSPNAESVVHRAMEVALADIQKVADAMENLRKEASVASVVTRGERDGGGGKEVEEKKKGKKPGSEIDAKNPGFGQNRSGSDIRNGDDDNKAQAEGNNDQVSEAGNDAEQRKKGRTGNGEAAKQAAAVAAAAEVEERVQEEEEEELKIITRLIKRAYRAVSTIIDDSAQITVITKSFKRNLLRADHLVKTWESVVKSDSKAKGMAPENSIVGEGGEGQHDSDESSVIPNDTLDIESWANADVDVDVNDINDDDDEQEKLVKMKDLREKIARDGEYLESWVKDAAVRSS